MTNVAPNLQLNVVPNNPGLSDLLSLFGKNLLLDFSAHHIGTIQSFDPVKQTASATIVYKQTFFQYDKVSAQYSPVLVDYPILLDCPCICLGGGNGALTFPIAKGDECVVLFNDRDIDNWFSGNSSGAAASARLHSFADGLILVGLRSLANVIPSYSGTAVEIRTKDGNSKVSVDTVSGIVTIKAGAAGTTITVGTDGKVQITNAGGELIAALYNLFTTATAGGFPLVNAPLPLAVLQGFKA